jgi:hypothetical protein
VENASPPKAIELELRVAEAHRGKLAILLRMKAHAPNPDELNHAVLHIVCKESQKSPMPRALCTISPNYLQHDGMRLHAPNLTGMP